MQFTAIISAALLSVAALAQPVERATAQWTITKFTRTCNKADTTCNYNFGINTNDGTAVTSCIYNVTGNPADRASQPGVNCGAFRVSSNWSGQFGPGKGFTTFAVVRNQQIVYPAYADSELTNATAVNPDKSYPVQHT